MTQLSKSIMLQALSKNYQNIITLVIFLSCLGLYLWLTGKGEYNLFSPTELKAIIREFGVFSSLIYMGILALSVVISPIPGAPLVVAGGAIFDFPLAGFYSVVGGFLGGLVAYLIGRTLGDSTLQSLTERVTFPPSFARSIEISKQYKDKHGGWLVFFSRLFPVLPFGFISYAFGIVRLPAPSYALGTLLGMIPPTLLLSYLGESLTISLMRTILVAVVLLLMLVGFPLLLRRYGYMI